MPTAQPPHHRKSYVIGGLIIGLLVLILLWVNRPTLADQLVKRDWFLFDDTTVSLKMNDSQATANDRLFNSGGHRSNKALAHVTFTRNGSGKLVTPKATQRFKWSLKQNVVTLRFTAQSKTARWTLAKTSGKVAGQRFKGYTVVSDDVAGSLFVGKGFLIYKR